MRAARRLGYTQSAISNQIAALERLVCARLVERVRGGSSISLTEAGRLLYDHAVVLIARLQAARTDVAAAGQESTAVLRVGYFQSVGATVLPRVVEAFRERALGVRVELELGFADGSLQERVAAGELDAAFVSTPIRADGIVSSHLFDDPFVLLAPPRGSSAAGTRLPQPAAARVQALPGAARARACAGVGTRADAGGGRVDRGCCDDPGAGGRGVRIWPPAVPRGDEVRPDRGDARRAQAAGRPGLAARPRGNRVAAPVHRLRGARVVFARRPNRRDGDAFQSERGMIVWYFTLELDGCKARR